MRVYVEVCVRIFVWCVGCGCVWNKRVGVGGVCMFGSFVFMFFCGLLSCV